MPPRFYLDYNAGAPLRAGVLACMQEVNSLPGNASSVHSFGRRARRYVDDAREIIAHSVGAEPAGVFFTGSGSEANALILHDKQNFFCSTIEHASVLAQQKTSATAGVERAERLIAVLPSGVVDCAALSAMLTTPSIRPQVVSVMAANNETGILQPIKMVAELCHRHGVVLHCDATQAMGRIPIAMDEWGVDFLTMSAHKLGGAQGIGALVCNSSSGVDGSIIPSSSLVRPLLLGGGQEGGMRAGTESVAAISGFGFALKSACEDLARMPEVQRLRDEFESRVIAHLSDVRIVGRGVPRLANTSCLIHPSISAEIMLMRCDLEGVAISAGSACSSGKINPSHVLHAMGYNDASCRNAVRVSIGLDTPPQALEVLAELFTRD